MKRTISLDMFNHIFTDRVNSPKLYHYTNINALFNGILLENESDDKKISLLATDHRYLNDVTEIKYGCDLMKKVVKAACDINVNKTDLYKENDSRYIISFSLNEDSIPMWSAYGKMGNGIALGFDTAIVKSTLKHIFPCFYTEDDLFDIINTLYKTSNSNSIPGELKLFFSSSTLVNIIKIPYYEYEHEVRYVTKDVDKIEYRHANNLIIPYHKVFLPKKALKSITIGPNLNIKLVKTSLQEYMNHLGFTDVKIIESKVPFRNL